MSKKFVCNRCGYCCTRSPVSLLPHEDIILQKLSEKYGLPYESSPGYMVYDMLSGVNIALSYVMKLRDGRCVFLDENNRCLIHDKYKPFICRSYPYVPKKITYSLIDDLKLIVYLPEYGVSSECPVVRDEWSVLEKTGLKNSLEKYFEKEIMIAREMENLRMLMFGLLSKLWSDGAVDLDNSSRYGKPDVNLYVLLRKYYPYLPYVIGMDKINY